jgi:hypothetical protein
MDDTTLAAIKAVDAAPVFQAYVAMAEGEANPTVFDDQSAKAGILEITRGAVATFVDSVRSKIGEIKDSLRLWVNHSDARNAAEANQQRPAIAYVAGARTMTIGQKLYGVIAAYFPPESRAHAGQYDSVSAEFNFESDENKTGRHLVDKIVSVFGIALLPKGARPAVSEAKSLGVAYAQYTPERGGRIMDLTAVNFEDLVSEMRRRHTQFKQIYLPDQLIGKRHRHNDGTIQWIGGDSEVNGIVNKVIEDTLAKEREEIEAPWKEKIKALEEKEKEIADLKAESLRFKAVPSLQAKVKELKLDAVLAGRIDRRAAQFTPGEDLDKSIQEFIDREKAEYEADLALMPEDKRPTPNLGGTDTGRSADSNAPENWIPDYPEEFK